MPKRTADTLAGLRILLVEDDATFAMMLEDMLQDFGCVVAWAASIEDALASVERGTHDGALLDLNMRGRGTVAVAEALSRRGVPFLLVTGYGAGETDPPAFRTAPRLQKPFMVASLARRMAEVFGRA